MLTRLEIVGFKSFAEKTRFDFAPGITAVVGPNGSGKSNIVDAIKWVLGEQSAKSLRGGEMADVIFNGSSSRKSLGLAEVTMTFDNARRQLAFDGPEVQITRRVYRDGQGEYLINGQPSRLKDIKEMFLGSGAGHGAYSIIEQGRVDALLTASTKDRRAIFEEAAGISRFKAKKLETFRKLEHVDADLTRVRDILAELDKQLRSLRLQAAKAQRYQEYSTRLKELRLGLGRREYAELAEMLAAEDGVLAGLRGEVAAAQRAAEEADAALNKLTWDLGRTEDAIRHQDAKLGDARQQIAAAETAAKAERNQAAAQDAELLKLGRQRAELTGRLKVLEADAARTRAEGEQVAGMVGVEEARASAAAAAAADVAARIADLTRTAQADRDRQFEIVGRAARLHSDAETSTTQLDRLQRDLTRKQSEAQSLSAKNDALEAVLVDLSRTDEDVRHRLDHTRTRLAELQTRQNDLTARGDGLQSEIDVRREERSALRGRADGLEVLERERDGLGKGVGYVLGKMAAGETPADLLGLVADLLTVPHEIAPLVELALGDVAHRFVVRDAAAVDGILAALGELPGRVGFLPLDPGGPDRSPPETPAVTDGALRETEPGFAERVRSEIAPLPGQLLGNVRFVADVPEARAARAAGVTDRLMTRTGDLLEPDGTLVVGPVHAEAGIVSRKSELRDLRGRIERLDSELTEIERQRGDFRREAEALGTPIVVLTDEIVALQGEVGSIRDRLVEQRQVQKQLADSIDLLVREADLTAAEVRRQEARVTEVRALAAEAERAAGELQERLAATDAALAAAGVERDARQAESTAAQVALGRVKEQHAALTARVSDLEGSLRQRKVDAVNLGSAEKSARVRRLEGQLAALRATQAAAEAYADKAHRELLLADLTTQREALRADRDRVQADGKAARAALQQVQDRAHAHDLTVRDLTNRRDALAARLKEDYGVDLADPAGRGADAANDGPNPGVDSPGSPEQTQDEIDDLRRKIAKLGSVNLEALDELAEVEGREKALRAQHDDLVTAAKTLAEIIEKINTDSRTLFTDTLAAVTVHFQELFRKLFGGGKAEIILEDEADVLECGIEVTARPPGKELRSISLLSGGEKTLTAVALLLAIFRSRPSPFCILDEVDAALDEANTVRFAGVLKEFTDHSQFIVVTHKKRTMAAADVLYGITMQESGVSKQVAVRFEDWPEEGQAAA